jgi:hypothetical protein
MKEQLGKREWKVKNPSEKKSDDKLTFVKWMENMRERGISGPLLLKLLMLQNKVNTPAIPAHHIDTLDRLKSSRPVSV